MTRLGVSGCCAEFDLTSLFRTTATIHVSNLIDIMKVNSSDELMNLHPNVASAKKKVKNFAAAKPAIIWSLPTSDMSPQEIFIKTVDQIKALIIPCTQNPTTTDDLLKQEGKIY